jgi:hypothetical protein
MELAKNSVISARTIRRVDLETVPGILVRGKREDDSRRHLLKLFKKETAAEFIGAIAPGFHRWGFSKGQFSLIDIIENLQSQLGILEDFAISTWTIADADLTRLHALLTADRIRRFRLLVDLSFQRRQPALIAHLRQAFGEDAIRVTRNHAKFLLFTAGPYRVVCRTSMNLNLNPRLEDIEIKDDPELHAFLSGILDGLFHAHEAKTQIGKSVRELGLEFGSLKI